MQWNTTGTVAPQSLSRARLEAHYGALILGSTAHAVLEHVADDSHTNLGFEARTSSLSTHVLQADSGLRLHLDLPALTLVFRRDLEEVSRLPLDQQGLASALEWVGRQLTELTGSRSEVVRREYPDFPASPISDGGVFVQPPEAELTEIARWFGNGLDLIESLREGEPALSPTRVWPHHFDIGAILPVASGAERMIGLGLSPGDGSYDQPYFYCSPYPAPQETGSLPELPVGHWHTAGFVSAALTGDELLACPNQEEAARQYLAGAVGACHALLA